MFNWTNLTKTVAQITNKLFNPIMVCCFLRVRKWFESYFAIAIPLHRLFVLVSKFCGQFANVIGLGFTLTSPSIHLIFTYIRLHGRYWSNKVCAMLQTYAICKIRIDRHVLCVNNRKPSSRYIIIVWMAKSSKLVAECGIMNRMGLNVAPTLSYTAYFFKSFKINYFNNFTILVYQSIIFKFFNNSNHTFTG